MTASAAPFTGTGSQGWPAECRWSGCLGAAAASEHLPDHRPLPVKNTFIHFDTLDPVLGVSMRPQSCPPKPQSNLTGDVTVSLGVATGELCHTTKDWGSCDSPPLSTALKSHLPEHEDAGARADAASQASTTSGERTQDAPAEESLGETWLAVLKKKAKVHGNRPKPAAVVPQPQSHRGSDRGKCSQAPQHTSKGWGKGCSHFERIPVGIEDDNKFRVLQRLIGPQGLHMRRIENTSQGAKLWIVGRGTRSWQDNAGPLTICVSALSAPVFKAAVGLVHELLDEVREEYRNFKW